MPSNGQNHGNTWKSVWLKFIIINTINVWVQFVLYTQWGYDVSSLSG